MIRSAEISKCGRYRYLLRREWAGSTGANGQRVLWIMLNPSVADGTKDDPTIRRCFGFSSRIPEVTAFEVVNLFAYRATDPDELRRVHDPIGPGNEDAISEAVARSQYVVCAWGAHSAASGDALQRVRYALEHGFYFHSQPVDPILCCLGQTASGAPRHPLYVKASQRFIPIQLPRLLSHR